MPTIQKSRAKNLARRSAFLLVVLVAVLAAGFVAQQVVVHRSSPLIPMKPAMPMVAWRSF
jgi:hypothetical protein